MVFSKRFPSFLTFKRIDLAAVCLLMYYIGDLGIESTAQRVNANFGKVDNLRFILELFSIKLLLRFSRHMMLLSAIKLGEEKKRWKVKAG